MVKRHHAAPKSPAPLHISIQRPDPYKLATQPGTSLGPNSSSTPSSITTAAEIASSLQVVAKKTFPVQDVVVEGNRLETRITLTNEAINEMLSDGFLESSSEEEEMYAYNESETHEESEEITDSSEEERKSVARRRWRSKYDRRRRRNAQ